MFIELTMTSRDGDNENKMPNSAILNNCVCLDKRDDFEEGPTFGWRDVTTAHLHLNDRIVCVTLLY